MSTIAVSVTEFSRSLSDFLNQVQYQGQTLSIERGKRVIAKVSPAETKVGYPISQLDELFGQAAALSTADRLTMAKDVKAIRGS
jgi:antitoxin (DNA-binding transcriptional repressor) of toxin-antitoxin stability system